MVGAMTPEAQEAARLSYLTRELVTAVRNYYVRSELVNPDRESVRAAMRLGDLLDAFDNRKDPTQ